LLFTPVLTVGPVKVHPVPFRPDQRQRQGRGSAIIAERHVPVWYRFHFVIDKECRYCGLMGHYKSTDGQLSCPMALGLTKKGVHMPCAYSFCEARSEHGAGACHTLHARCMACGLRGHTDERCQKMSSALAIANFEHFADFGVYTKLRESELEWGIYPITFEDYFDPAVTHRSLFPLTYQGLLALPHCTAVATVVAFNAMIRAKMGVIDPHRRPRILCERYYFDNVFTEEDKMTVFES
jgi:hypothetical protein